jgi:hypothetical protein
MGVGKKRDDETFFLGIGIKLEEIRPDHRVAPGQGKPHTAFRLERIQDTLPLGCGQLPLFLSFYLTITMDAIERTLVGKLQLAAPGEMLFRVEQLLN